MGSHLEGEILIFGHDIGPCREISNFLSSKRVLSSIVHDRNTLQQALERPGIKGLLFSTGPDLESISDIIKHIRSQAKIRNLPLIICASIADEGARVHLLDSGADSLISPPVSPVETLARLQACLRRPWFVDAEQSLVEFNDLKLDRANNRALVGGQDINLTRTEFNILECLLLQIDQVFSRRQLAERLLTFKSSTEQNVNIHIFSLRRKLKHISKHLQTVRSQGYIFRSNLN